MHLHSLILLMLLWQQEEKKEGKGAEGGSGMHSFSASLSLLYRRLKTLACIDGLFTGGIVSGVS